MESEHVRDTASPALPIELEDSNTSTTNVHSTPFKPPETDFARLNLIESIESPIPLRRSPRHSIAPAVPPHLALDDFLNGQGSGAGTPSSRPETPDNDGLVQDEPSSVLASRIMRAHDNPSPPPQSPENTLLHPKFGLDPSDTSLSPTPDPVEDPFLHGEPFESVSAMVPIPRRKRHSAEQNNLEDTDSLSDAGPSEPPPNNIIVEDVTPMTEVHDTHAQSHTTPDPPTTSARSPSSDEEQAVMDSLLIEEPVHTETQINSVDPAPEPEPVVQEATHQEEEVQVTPLRRSSRPRRSIYSSSPLKEGTVANDSPSSKPDETQTPAGAESELANAVPSPSRRKPRKSGHQKLASLSPHSLKLLGDLSGEGSGEGSESVATLGTDNAAIEPTADLNAGISRWPDVAPSTPPNLIPPIRFPSPKRTTRPASPNKYQLQLPSLGSSSPARRIPISDAVAQGQISPQRAAQSSATRPTGANRTPALRLPSNDTPARRVPLNNTLLGSPSKAPLPPLRMPFPERSRSVEPMPSEPVHVKQRGESVEPVSSQPPIRPRGTQPRLPFPFIPEEREHTPIEQSTERSTQAQASDVVAPLKSPTKASRIPQSTLRQATSKIPRRATKPYSRPTASAVAKESASRVRNQGPAKVAQSKSTVLKQPTPSAQSSSSSTPISAPSSKSTQLMSTSTNPGLKRKRQDSVKAVSKPAVVIPTKLRQVPSPAKPSTSSRVQPSPVKKPAIQRLRLVEPEKPPQPPSTDVPVDQPVDADPVEPPAQDVASPPVIDLIPQDDSLPSDTPTIDPPPPAEVVPESGAENMLVDEEPVAGPSTIPIDDSVPDLPSQTVAETYGLRRTTRARKPVPGTNPPSTRRAADSQAQPRRRKPPVIQGTGPFSGMTAGDLRQLTSTNTTRNQQYMTALLEMEVIRREGPRPESPGIRAKTVSQKEEEEKEREKHARAERRANRSKRRSGEHMDDNMEGSEKADPDEDEDDEAWDQLNSSPSVRRHRRGAGEDEEYVTPKRPKKLKVDENGDTEMESEDAEEKKRVKWDQGLFTEVFLDDIQPRSRQGVGIAAKGCLAVTAKALQLDDLGNIPAASPLKSLVPENVIVQKFVYDGDFPEEPAPAPAPVVVKNTRSRKKGASS
ncbi:hypothetical protein PQX77_004604 [Marasmius sp. AFHP31]|nr:hypothetical protein PQX77_004604 [Marasmius sp. AFHP31]